MNFDSRIGASATIKLLASRLAALPIILMLAANCAQAADVASLSNDKLVPKGDDAYWQATVKCEGSSTEFTIEQKRKEQEWCMEDQQLPCEQSKMDMAIAICLILDVLSSTSTPAVAPQPAPETTQRAPEPPQQETEQQSSESQAQAELTAAIRAEEATLLAERRRLEAEKQALARAEQELSIEERKLEERLRELED